MATPSPYAVGQAQFGLMLGGGDINIFKKYSPKKARADLNAVKMALN
jgi:hypothetical protein